MGSKTKTKTCPRCSGAGRLCRHFRSTPHYVDVPGGDAVRCPGDTDTCPACKGKKKVPA
jgi:hypothetical protein